VVHVRRARAGARDEAAEALTGRARPRADGGSLTRRELLAGALALAAAACHRSEKKAVAPRAARIVSVSPSMTESVFAVGKGALMVGRTTFCDYPPEAEKLPTVGGFLDASLEKILSLQPTLVVGERRPGGKDLDERLRASGIETFFPPMYDVAQIEQMIGELGAKLDVKQKAAEVVASMKGAIERAEARVASLGRPKTLFLFDFHPLVAAGPDAFPNEILTLAGAANAVTTGGEYPRLSPEAVLALDPDVVIDGSAGAYAEPPAALVAGVPGLSSLRALREGKVVRLATKTALRPGPRIGEGVLEIAGLVHPEGE
jgi:iron complex transport system substrate-binding protein